MLIKRTEHSDINNKNIPIISCNKGPQASYKEVHHMTKRKANHVIPGMNASKSQGDGAGYNEEFSNEPLTEQQRQNNKKRKKNQ